ncbi:thioredoxin family protein [Leifsonia sp. NCR5]|uniref:thioredoxin family protein n=1 Tax=Leifsonia sp. NCR5 TaxID=1978342 RepID=UPI000A196D94|nr:thioredoxin family protein [Leifsonia sp. NCR5]
MRIEVLHIEECPNWEHAGDRVREALDRLGDTSTTVAFRLLQTSEDAASVSFAGSPTITVDGEDLFPNGAQTTDLACRIYFTPNGVAGLPTVDQLEEAISARG